MSKSNMSKAQRREAARAEALAIQQKQAARDRRNRMLTFGVLGVAVLGLAVVVWMILSEGQKNAVDDRPLSEVTLPATAQPDGGIPVGADGAAGTTNDGAPVIDVYLDYMCPVCGQFEEVNAADIDAMVAAGDATVVYHPISILDRTSRGTEYSTRSASAVAWVADRAPEAFPRFQALLFENQPEEGTEGLTDSELAAYAEEAGAAAEVADGIEDGTARETFGQYVYSATNTIGEDPNFPGTPYVLVDGEAFQGWNQPGALAEAVGAGVDG
jgi:protein-disulfide isomerase